MTLVRMMARPCVFFAAVMLFAFVSARPAAAQSVAEAGTWTATPFLGVTFGVSGGLGDSLALGAAIGYDFTDNVGVEGELGYTFDVLGHTGDVDWSLTTVSANAIYHFDVLHVTPYATLGVGFERSNPKVRNPDPLAIYQAPTTEVAWNFGGGAKYRLTEGILARVDLRRFQANDAAPDHWRLYGGLTFRLRGH